MYLMPTCTTRCLTCLRRRLAARAWTLVGLPCSSRCAGARAVFICGMYDTIFWQALCGESACLLHQPVLIGVTLLHVRMMMELTSKGPACAQCNAG